MSIAKTTRPHLLTREAAAARIEALEAALQKIIENNDHGSYESTGQAIDEARAALAPEQDK